MSEISGGWLVPPAPPRETLSGRYARLEPLDGAAHAASLHSAMHNHDDLWRYMAYGPFGAEADFQKFLSGAAASGDPLYFAVVDAQTRQALGWLSIMSIRPDMGVAEIGSIVLSPALQKSRTATEAFFLVIDALFEAGYRRVEWKCDARNRASRKAAQRLGFRFEGLFLQHMVVKGENRDTAWFALLDHEWEKQRLAFKGWLEPANFDADAQQLRPLVSFEAPPTLGG